jgi:hypothetical protein
VRDEGGRGLGKAQGTSKPSAEEMLRCVVGHGEGCGYANNVLCASTPPVSIDWAANELIQETIIHLFIERTEPALDLILLATTQANSILAQRNDTLTF